MKTPEQENRDLETPLIGRLIEARLRARLRDESSAATPIDHPDDDRISAFMEGRLEDAESLSIISHLVRCAACLHLTADLARLGTQMDEVGSASIPDYDPGPWQRLLERIAEGATLSNDDAVFAYQEKDESGPTDQPEPDPDAPAEP